MRKLSIVITVLLLFTGCSYVIKGDDKAREYSKIEITLSDFSKKIVAYYERQKQPIPAGFDERQFIEILERVYPDQSKVEMIKRDFKIKTRSIDNNYSVVLCEPTSEDKLMEDFSCTLNKVDITYWDKGITAPCEFDQNWEIYCK